MQTQNNDQDNIALAVLTELEVRKKDILKENIEGILKTKDFLWVKQGSHKALLEIKTKLLWEVQSTYPDCNVNNIKAPRKLFGIDDWSIPAIGQLRAFNKVSNNPLHTSRSKIHGLTYWMARENSNNVGIDLDAGYEDSRRDSGHVIYVNTVIAQDLVKFINFSIDNNVCISSIGNPDIDILQPLKSLLFSEVYTDIDYNRCRLPKLEQNQMIDSEKGLWEFNGLNQELLKEQSVRARNPVDDVRDTKIGIDFGTSSTVVAYENINGNARLLRIGVDDYYEEALPEHYENPTILEFIDFPKMLKDWQKLAQQPLVNWNDVRCSHEALHNFRNNDTNPKVVASILSKLKQWALRENSDNPIRLTDQVNEYEHQLSHLELRNPVKGSALQVSNQDSFDPIELYAWFLGLNINWRSRGIFLHYYMTFPVAYPKNVKEKILSSFRRGLLRSLPDALMANTEVIEQFTVKEIASEPAAYAASAMKAYGLEPTDSGVAYAVFDFGGGTTDFDFGYYRWARDEESDNGEIEEIFEHFEAAGDKFLGGENLLENMAYLVFRHNLDLCRQNKIAFTKPLDAEDFTGSELLVDKTQAAHTNILILMSRLRSFWEKNESNPTGIESLNLLNRNGEKVPCELKIPLDELSNYLDTRIAKGVESFYQAMKKAFNGNMPKEIHVLLAGNSSRSARVKKAFNVLEPDERTLTDGYEEDIKSNFAKLEQVKIFGEKTPKMIIHSPLEADIHDESQPTAKTGVALGILRLCPGSAVKVINRASEMSDGEAPFAYYVGRGRRGKFQVGLVRNAVYGEWQEIGVVPTEGVFNYYITQSNLAHGNEMAIGHVELYKRSITFPMNCVGQKIYISAKTPASINIGCTDDLSSIQAGHVNALQEVTF